MRYVAVIGDMKDSRNLDDRYAAQKELKKVLEEINEKYENELAAKFLITLGDEFQGLVRSSRHVLGMIKYIQKKMYPVTFRFGVGIGTISTEINPEFAIGADGPAFYAAREMVEDLRAKERKSKTQEGDIQFSIYGENSFEIERINTLLSLIKLIEDKWKDEQRITIWDMYDHGGSQKDCADRMNTTQSTIGRRLAGGNYYLYQRAMEITGRSIAMLEDV
ncbi:MAG: SatD family protein [Eubacteriales bacterium]|nr:SatD family protein [Eubacteriales bacterium]